MGPINVAFSDYDDNSEALADIDATSGWSAAAATARRDYLRVTRADESKLCDIEVAGSQRRHDYINGSRGTLRLWSASRHGEPILVGSAYRTDTKKGGCLAPGAFDFAQRDLSSSFVGPHPVASVEWGNTRSFIGCGGAMVRSTGVAKVHRQLDFFGYHEALASLWGDATTPAASALAADGGSNVARFGIDWDLIAHDATADDASCTTITPDATCGYQRPASYDWSSANNAYRQLASAGVRPLITLTDVPPGLASNCTSNLAERHARRLDPTQAAYGELEFFLGNVAEHFSDLAKAPVTGGIKPVKIVGFEIWNEPNSKLFWGGCAPSVNEYSVLYRHAYHAIFTSGAPLCANNADRRDRLNRCTADIALGAPSPGKGDDENGSISWKRWIRGVLREIDTGPDINDGAYKTKIDRVALHPYRTLAEYNHERPLVSIPDAVRKQVEDARTIVDNALGPQPHKRRLWVTEVGVQTSDNGFGKTWYEETDAEQAADLVEIYNELRNGPYKVEMVVIHKLIDDPLTPEADRNYNTTSYSNEGAGVVSHDRSLKKLAWKSLKRVRGRRP